MKSVLYIDCGDCRSRLVPFLHGDVSPLLRRHITRHLDCCPECYRLYLLELDLMRDLKRDVPRIGAGHQPHFDRVWLAIQNDIVKSKPVSMQFQIGYGLVMLVLILGFLLPSIMGDKNLTLADPPTQPTPLAEQVTPNSTEPGTAVALSLLIDQSQATPEPPHQTVGPSLDVIRTP